MARKSDGLVVNAVEWDGAAKWAPPSDVILILSDTAAIGDTWNGYSFVPAPAPVASTTTVAPLSPNEITALRALIPGVKP